MINLQNWGVIRIVRLAVGILMLWNTLADHQLLVGFIGGFLVIQAILNTGCGAGGCGIPPMKKSITETANDIEYEEVR